MSPLEREWRSAKQWLCYCQLLAAQRASKAATRKLEKAEKRFDAAREAWAQARDALAEVKR